MKFDARHIGPADPAGLPADARRGGPRQGGGATSAETRTKAPEGAPPCAPVVLGTRVYLRSRSPQLPDDLEDAGVAHRLFLSMDGEEYAVEVVWPRWATVRQVAAEEWLVHAGGVGFYVSRDRSGVWWVTRRGR